jgi:hypothetical protein
MTLTEEMLAASATADQKDKLTRIVAAMLTGVTAPGDALIKQVVTIAKVIVQRIEAA